MGGAIFLCSRGSGARVFSRAGTLFAFLVPLFFAGPSLAQQQTVGLATDVRGLVTGDLRTLLVGNDVFFNETIRTDDTSRVRLQFLDETQLYVAQRSEVVLDRFVYDPDQSAGDVTLSLVRGTFRFVTGVQDSSSYHVETPIATIGVRGTIWHGLLTADLLLLALEDGAIYAELPNGLVVELFEPGWCVEIHSDSTIVGPVPCEGFLDDPYGIGWNEFGDVAAGPPGNFGRPFNFGSLGNSGNVVPCLNLSCN